MDVILMGLRGSGKSTLARALAGATASCCVDLDDRVAALLGHSSPTAAWNAMGEVAFRHAEVRALVDAIGDETPIIALGGGTPMAPGAFDLLHPRKRLRPPRIVYLRAPASVLASRMARGDARPSLLGTDPIAEIPAVLAKRDPFYLGLADAVIEVGELTESEALVALLGLVSG